MRNCPVSGLVPWIRCVEVSFVSGKKDKQSRRLKCNVFRRSLPSNGWAAVCSLNLVFSHSGVLEIA